MSEQQILLWAPTFVLQYGRRRHLSYQKNTMEPTTCIWVSIVLWTPTNCLIPDDVGNKTRKHTHSFSLSKLVRPSPSPIKGDALSPNREMNQFTTQTTHTIRTTKDPNKQQTFKHLAHSRAPVTLSSSDRSLTGPLAHPIFLLSICNPTTNFEHLGSGIKSPTDSN